MKVLLMIVMLFGLAFAAIDINTASKQELMSLDGIGEKKAEAIIEYRSKNKFTTKEDITKVKGISKKILNKIEDKISVDSKVVDKSSKETKKSKKTR